MPARSRSGRARRKPQRPRPAKWVGHRREIEAYCDAVLSDAVVVGKLERAAVERYRRDCESAGSRGLYLDEDDLNLSIDFIQILKHSTGEFAGQNFLLGPFQKFVVGNLFGWKRREDHLRRFREAFISMGRGNGKSPFTAAIVNRINVLDREQRAYFQLAGVERAQAEIVFNEMVFQLESQPAFAGRFEFYRAKHGKKSIVDTLLNSVVEPLGTEGRDGYNLLAFVMDEIHAWTDEHLPLYDKLQTSMAKRRQPLGLIITTAGDDRSKLWLRVRDFSAKVALGVQHEDRHFSFICEIAEEDKKPSLYDETLWRKGNPNLDISVKREGLRLRAAQALNDTVSFNQWLRYYMNVRVRSVQKVIDPETWRMGNGELPDLAGKPCHAALDFGWRNDLASLYLAFPLPGRKWALKGWNWYPRHGGRNLTAAPWSDWIRDGHLTVTDGEATDHEAIFERINDIVKRYQILSFAIDPANARVPGQIIQKTVGNVFDFYQNYLNFNEPIREFLQALKEGRILHGGDPVLAWAADNLVTRTNSAGLVMPAKDEADEKIDPMVASLMAVARCMLSEPEPGCPRVAFL